jgi:hypothetical protein
MYYLVILLFLLSVPVEAQEISFFDACQRSTIKPEICECMEKFANAELSETEIQAWSLSMQMAFDKKFLAKSNEKYKRGPASAAGALMLRIMGDYAEKHGMDRNDFLANFSQVKRKEDLIYNYCPTKR